MKAKHPKNNKAFNNAIKYLKKYNEANDLRDLADNNGDDKLYRKYDRQCEVIFDKYEDWCYELPKYEVKRIEKSELYADTNHF